MSGTGSYLTNSASKASGQWKSRWVTVSETKGCCSRRWRIVPSVTKTIPGRETSTNWNGWEIRYCSWQCHLGCFAQPRGLVDHQATCPSLVCDLLTRGRANHSPRNWNWWVRRMKAGKWPCRALLKSVRNCQSFLLILWQGYGWYVLHWSFGSPLVRPY